MYNTATEKALEELKGMGTAIGTIKAAEILGISPRGFKRYLESLETLPFWVFEVSDMGERRTFRVLTERFAVYLAGRDVIPVYEEPKDELPL